MANQSMKIDDLKNDQEVCEALWNASQHVRNADVLLIAAGAGMGVDAGLPDYYRGIDLAHPRIAEIGLSIYDLSNHALFELDPELAWGHWITRQRQYNDASPHIGYNILYSWSQCNSRVVRVVTTNLDRHFLRIGFAPSDVYEMHGSMYSAQCMQRCGVTPWALDIENMPTVDLNTMRLIGQSPSCIQCSGLARVSTALAVDNHWDASPVETARMQHETFFHKLSNEQMLTVLEIGCGTVMDKVRKETSRIVAEHRKRGGRAVHIRINLYEADIDKHEDNISLQLGALEALCLMHQLVNEE